MKTIRIPLNYRLTGDSFDARVVQLIGYLAGMTIVPVAVVALVRHPGNRAEFVIGLGLACLVALLYLMLGTLVRHIATFRDQRVRRSEWPAVAGFIACLAILSTGIWWSLAGLGLTPVQVTLALLLTLSLSLAVLTLGMLNTLVRMLKRVG